MPPDNKILVEDPMDVTGILIDAGGPYQTSSPTYETIAQSRNVRATPIGTYSIFVFGQILNTTNNAEGGFRLVAEGAELIGSEFLYESGTQDVAKTFALYAGWKLDEPRPAGSLTQFQGFTNAGTLTVQNIVAIYMMMAKRDVIQPVDFSIPP